MTGMAKKPKQAVPAEPEVDIVDVQVPPEIIVEPEKSR